MYFDVPTTQALASLRQKVKKYIKDADFEASVEEFRKVRAQGEPVWETVTGCSGLVYKRISVVSYISTT